MLASLESITKSYEQPGSEVRNIVLKTISLQIAKNERIAIVGPSGSGKSTLLNILGTLDKPSSGNLVLNSQVVNTLSDSELAAIRNTFLGFVFQMHHLLPQLTVLENVMLPQMPLQDRNKIISGRERALYLLNRVGLSEHTGKYPSQLSVGECQRTAMVRALINQPRLLLADEPTGSLDAANAAGLADLLLQLNREEDVALVIVTHSMELASRMDTIYHLREGSLKCEQRES